MPCLSDYSKYSMSFRYSLLFWLIIITDIGISIILVLGLFSYFNSSSENFHKPEVLFFTLLSPLNLLIDTVLVYFARKNPDIIDLRLSWIKGLAGFLGGYTSISGLYFLIISYQMHAVFNKNQVPD